MSIHGYKPYRPSQYAGQVLRAARAVLVEYEAWNSPMTVRQVFYRLVAEYSYAKTEKAYGSLINYIARSRRAYMHRVLSLWEGPEADSYQDCLDEALTDPILIPFSWIRDERGHTQQVTHYDDVDDFARTVENAVQALQMDRQEGQPQVLELWCEAAGMVPLMADIARPYGIRVSSGGGYDSVTAKHRLAKRIDGRSAHGYSTIVLHVGDFDPSGEGMFYTLRDDVSEMVEQLGSPDEVDFDRIALTGQQVVEMGVETAPPKPLDSRRRQFIARHLDICEELGSNDITAQLEALTPPELRRLIEGAIERYVDADTLADVERREQELRGEIRERMRL